MSAVIRHSTNTSILVTDLIRLWTGTECDGDVTEMQRTKLLEVWWRMSTLWPLFPLLSVLPFVHLCCLPRQIRFDILVTGHEEFVNGETYDYSVSSILSLPSIIFIFWLWFQQLGWDKVISKSAYSHNSFTFFQYYSWGLLCGIFFKDFLIIVYNYFSVF